MKRLEYLRNRLIRLGRHRRLLRRTTALSAVAIALLASLVVIFALDWSFQRSDDTLQRLFLLALGAGAVVWAAYRYSGGLLGGREDCLQMALVVERHAGIDSDLVAALQFESPEAVHWGSPQLETAVIEKVSTRQRNIDLSGVLPWRPLVERARILAVVVAVWIAALLLCPEHVRVFFSRMLLGKEHYPTQTKVVELTVNGKKVDFGSSTKAVVRVPFGRPVTFEVTATGRRLPIAGRVELSGAGSGQAVVPLEQVPESADNQNGSVFKGQYDRLMQTVEYQVFVGDAWIDRCGLEVIPAPIIEVEPEYVLPEYAQSEEEEAVQKLPRGTNQFAVLEGSEVRLKVHSDRALKSVVLTGIGDAPITLVREDNPSNEPGELWAPKTAGTPLAAVVNPLRYAVQVIDADDAALERPVEGFVRIEADKVPRAAAATRTPVIQPGAKPTIYYKAADDYALSRVWLTWEVNGGQAPASVAPATNQEAAPAVKEAAPVTSQGATAATPEEIAAAIKGGGAPVTNEELASAPKQEIVLYTLKNAADAEPTINGESPFDLGPLGLKPGDTLKVTLHATDYRGERPGKTGHAEPVIFNVTDEQGVMSSLRDGDLKTASEIEKIINNLLGLGGSP